jgi:tetratricopeptide (TPR) repeat protein
MLAARLVFLTFLAIALASSYPAHADDKAMARAHYETAARLYDVGEYDRALVEFKDAYVAKPDPAFLFNIGQCYRKLGQEDQALDYYRRFLKVAAPDDPNRAQVEARLRDTETDAVFKDDLARAEEREEAAAVAVPWAGAVAPSPTEAAPPTPKVADSRELSANRQQLSANRQQLSANRQIHQQPRAIRQQADPPTGRGLRIAGIITAAVGVASIGTAIYFYARARSYSDIVSNYRYHTAAAEQAGRDCETAQWVLYSVGAVVLATGAVLYWRGMDVKPVVTPGLAGISMGGTFR